MGVSSVVERILMEVGEGELIGLFFDFDGTISHIVDNPDMARILAGARECLLRMAECDDIVAGVISGRAMDDLKERVDVPGLVYSGNHGAELELFGDRQVISDGEAHAVLADFAMELESTLSYVSGIRIENKGYSVSVHTRCVDDSRVEDVKNLLKETAGKFHNLITREGKRVFEVLPSRSATKGDVMHLVLERVEEIYGRSVFPVYFGDDVTDRYVYEYMRKKGKGLFIFVAGKDRVQLDADFELEGPPDVVKFMADFLRARDVKGKI